MRAPEAAVDAESIRWYLSSIGQHDLLSVSDEQLLSMDVQELTRWNDVRSTLEHQLAREPTKAEWSRAVGFDAVRERDEPTLRGVCFEGQLASLKKAKERMIQSNLRLVVKIAKAYANRGLGLQDLIQEGTLGLITAVDKFDGAHSSNAKFSSYASWWIKQRVSRAVGKAGCIRLPARMPSLIYQVQKERESFRVAVGRDPTHTELASACSISVGRLKLVLSASRDPLSLDAELQQANYDRRTLADVIPDAAPIPDVQLASRLFRATIAKSIHGVLDAEEHAVICSAYNLLEDRKSPLTYKEIAKRYGKSVKWVERVEARALKKLKGRPQLRNLLSTRDVTVDGLEDWTI